MVIHDNKGRLWITSESQKTRTVLHVGLVFNEIHKFTELTEYVSSAFAVNSVVQFALICHICYISTFLWRNSKSRISPHTLHLRTKTNAQQPLLSYCLITDQERLIFKRLLIWQQRVGVFFEIITVYVGLLDAV